MKKFVSVFCVLLIVLLVLPIFLFGFVSSVNANPTVVTVGTSTASGPILMSFQKKTFYCSGNSRWYAWYDTGSQFGYETSLDGIDWTGTFTNYYASHAYYFDLWYDEANDKICLVRSQGTIANIYYRQGTANSNGTITWDSAEVLITTDATYRPCLCKDSDGYPWVSYVAISSYDEKVCKATATNGSAWGTPTTLWANRASGNEQIKILPLTNGKMLAVSSIYGLIQSRLHNGISWETAVNASSSGPANYALFDIVADGDNAHLIFCGVTNYNVTYVKYTYSSWGNEEQVDNSTIMNSVSITLKSTDKVRCFYYTSLTTIKYRDGDEGVWQTAVTISSSQSTINMLSSSYKAFSNYYCVMWKSKTSSPYNVTFEGYTLNTANGTGPVHNLNTGYNYTTIQEAIDANETLDGHTIFVEERMYLEHVFVGKELTLIGENRSKTIIDGNGTGTVVYLGTNATITNFTIRNGEYGVKISSYSLTPVYRGNTINNTKIVDNVYGAILIRGCANNTIANNIIVNNTLFGIHLWHAGNNTIINNIVVNNGHGIDFYGNCNDNILRNNNMTENEYNFGLILREETRNYLVGPSMPNIVNDVDTSNTVNGKPIYYLINRSNVQIPSDAGYVWLNNCTNIEVNGCNLSDNIQGVLLVFCNNASIINNNITNNVYGVYVGPYCNNNTLVGNTLKDNLNGIYLDAVSKFTTMRNNNISGGQMNFGVSPDIARHIKSGSDLINDIDTSNTVDGKSIVYWIDQHGRQVPANAGYVMLINSTNIRIENLELSNNIQNVFLLASNDTIIANSSITNSIYGIVVSDYGWYDFNTEIYHRFYSFNTTVKGNTLVDNGVGIRIRSDNSTVSNNTLYRNPLGICLSGTSNSMISKNVVIESNMSVIPPSPPPDLCIFYYPVWPWEYSRELAQLEIGGIIVGGEYNIIYGNTVRDSYYGIFMFERISNIWGVDNTVFHNNFIDNTPYQAMGPPKGGNDFDNGYPCGGNYWSNYNGTDLFSGQYRNETGSDGIGDTVFWVFPVLQSQVVDIYPLMAPINIFDAGIWNGTCRDISIISNSSISNFQINKTQNTISFNVTHQTSLVFFRVSIPNVIVHEFWQDNYTVFVNGQPVESRNWMDEYNAYIYFTYENPNEVVIIPEFSSFPIVLVFMMATLLAVTVRKRKSH